MNKTTSTKTNRYHLARHHGWAGSVMLTILLAIRVFFELLEITLVPNIIFFAIGAIIIMYIAIALGFTYKYRKELLQQQSEQVIHHVVEHKPEKDDPKLKKEELKLEKKKAKAAVKAQKKKD